jgi:hypothetical protein
MSVYLWQQFRINLTLLGQYLKRLRLSTDNKVEEIPNQMPISGRQILRQEKPLGIWILAKGWL